MLHFGSTAVGFDQDENGVRLHFDNGSSRSLAEVERGDAALLDALAGYESDMRAEVFPILRASADPHIVDA